MASEYLRKSVADRRTGANLIGISVDTSNIRDLTPEFEMAFNQLEAFAKETDNLKIESEKRKIALEIAQSRVDFKEKYLSDPTVYNSQEKWNEVSKLYEEERKKAKKRISESKYLSADEKALYGEDVDLDFKKDWLDPLNKRNGAVIQERISAAMSNIDMITSIASMGNIYDNGVIEKAIKDIKTEYKDLISLGVQTESDMNFTLAQKIPMIEGSLFFKKLDQDIIKNPNYATAKEKMAEVDKIIDIFKNPERLEKISEQYGFEDNTKKYFELKTAEVYGNLKKDVERNLYNLSVQNKTQKSLEALQKKENNFDNKMIKAVEKNDPFEYIKVKYDLDLTTKEALSVQSSSYYQEMSGCTIADFKDPNNIIIGRVVSDEGISEIKGALSFISKNGTIEVTTQDQANIIEEYIARNYTEQGDDIAMRKDLGNRIPGLNPTVLLKGKENPIYYTTWDILKRGKDNKFGVAKNGNPLGLSGSSQRNYTELINTPIDKNGNTLNTVKGKQVLNRFLYGYMIMNKTQDAKLEKRMEKPEKALQYILENDNVFAKFKEMLPALYELSVSPINYVEARIKPYERQASIINNSEVKEDGTGKQINGI